VSILQRPPQDEAESQKFTPNALSPDQTLDYDEGRWYREVYRGAEFPQLTWRAILMGSALGFLLAFTNLYIGLKTGWGLGVAITACILSYALWSLFLSLGIAKTPMTILETNCMQSTASSAGYATGGTMVSAIAALLMLSASEQNPQGQHLPATALALWTALLGALGTVMAIPMKRNLINHERLKFPSGTAAATTLHSLYSEGKEAIVKARALALSALFGACFPILIELQLVATRVKDAATGLEMTVRAALWTAETHVFDAFLWTPGTHKTAEGVAQYKPSEWLMVLEHNPVMIAAGALVGPRLALWMLVGGLSLVYGVGPWGMEQVWTNPAGVEVAATSAPYKAWKEVGLWLGVAVMVSSGLLSFVMQWRTIARAFSGLRGVKGEGDALERLTRETEVPMSWFIWGASLAGAGVVVVGDVYFEIPWHYGVLAVFLSFALSLVACRATGESDITPVGAMGKVMQLTYGVLIPQSTTANLMTASVTASTAGSAADLLNDLKSGYLLGANPRRQFLAQLIGIFSGTIATVSGFYLLVPDAITLLGAGGEAPRFPAPAAQAWKAVAELFKHGLDNMHPAHQQVLAWGVGLGVTLVLLEALSPKLRPYLPSATGLSLGLILPFQYPLSMALGALGAWAWQRQSAEAAERFLVPISAGVIAGVSIMGVIVAILNNALFGG